MITQNSHKKDRILDIAESVFSKLGYEGASTRVISREAGINLAMLNYYFGSKEGLFMAVFERKIYALRSLLQNIGMNTGLSCWEKLDRCVDFYIDRFLVNDDFQRLIHREMSISNRHSLTEKITETLMTNVREFKVIFNEGVRNGSFKADADIQLLTTIIVGTKNYIVNTPNICSLLVDHDVTDSRYLEIELKPRLKTLLKKTLRDHLSLPA